MINGPGILPVSGGSARKLVVLFHGYGSCGEDLLSIAHYWKNLLPEAEFIAPNGIEKWEGYASGYQWFSLQERNPATMRDRLDKTAPVVKAWLDDILRQRDLSPGDLALAGFSQGGMLALEMMFVCRGVRGVISYSGGFYPPATGRKCSTETRALLVHGDQDTVVPYAALKEATYHLEQTGLVPQTLTCRGIGHSISKEGIDSGGKFLGSIFA